MFPNKELVTKWLQSSHKQKYSELDAFWQKQTETSKLLFFSLQTARVEDKRVEEPLLSCGGRGEARGARGCLLCLRHWVRGGKIISYLGKFMTCLSVTSEPLEGLLGKDIVHSGQVPCGVGTAGHGLLS